MFTTARTTRLLLRCVCRQLILVGLGASVLLGGCVPVPGSRDGGTTPPANDGHDDDGPANLAVSIQVSNRTPQLHEEVTFRCTSEGVASEPLVFDFHSPDVTLQVNSIDGTATFVVAESDLNLSFAVTCSVSDGTGRTAESDRVIVTPTA